MTLSLSTRAMTGALICSALLGSSACRKAEPVQETKTAAPEAAAAGSDKKTDIYDTTVPADVTFTHVPEIYKRGKADAVGKRAQIILKYTSKPKPDWLIMTAVDGSYQIAFLQFDPKFQPMVDKMEPGVPYMIDFVVTDVTNGGAPKGKITAVNRQSEFPVPNPEQPLKPAVEDIQKVEALPEEVKAERRKMMHETLKKQVDTVEPLLQERAKELEKEKK